MQYGLTHLLTAEFNRDFNLYEVTFIKHRQLNLIAQTRDLLFAARAMKAAKKRYKSARFRTRIPLKVLARACVTDNNPLLAMLEKHGKMRPLNGGRTIREEISFRRKAK